MERKKKVEVIYMAVTPDKYELPIYVSDDLSEIADHFNITKNNLKSSISHNRSGLTTGRKFIRVKVEDE